MTPGSVGCLEHGYGDRVTILENPCLHAGLVRIGQTSTPHPEIMNLLRTSYHALAMVAFGAHLPRVWRKEPTRMAEAHGDAGHWEGQVVDPSTQVVVLDVVRGGMVPSQVCFEMLTHVLPLENLRLDHVHMSRTTGADGHVDGVDLSGSKIGGSTEGAVLVVPDPMGATGSTLVRALDHLTENFGRPSRVIALPMIATPEFLARVLPLHPELFVVAGRVDRGLSSKEVLATPPGTHWDRERGLDDHDYIVPGAGGLGEVINNSWC